MSSRIQKFRELLDGAGLDGAVVRLPENVYYLSQVEFLAFRPCFAVVSPRPYYPRSAILRPRTSGRH